MTRVISLALGLPPGLLFFVWLAYGCTRPYWYVPPLYLYDYTPWWCWNTTLYLVFCLFHSGMALMSIARQHFILVNGLVVSVIMLCWNENGIVLWDLGWPSWSLLATLFLYAQIVVWTVPAVWGLLGIVEDARCLRTTGVYRYVRHPMDLFTLLFMFLTPYMTADRLLIAGLSVVYILAATPLEEARLVEKYGQSYLDYKRRTWWLWM